MKYPVSVSHRIGNKIFFCFREYSVFFGVVEDNDRFVNLPVRYGWLSDDDDVVDKALYLIHMGGTTRHRCYQQQKSCLHSLARCGHIDDLNSVCLVSIPRASSSVSQL